MQNILDQLNSFQDNYKKLPEHIRKSFLPWFITSIPVIIASILCPYSFMPLIVLISIILLYQVTQYTDTFIFELSSMEAKTRITLPLVALIPLWTILLAWFSRKEMLLGIVGPYVSILLLCAAPAYRMKATRMKRIVPLSVSFSILALFTMVASLNYIGYSL